LFHQCEVAFEVLALESGPVPAAVGGAAAGRCPVTADQASRQHAVGGDPDPELTARLQQFAFDVAGDERVLDLQVIDRVHRMSPPQRIRPHLGEPDVAHVPRVDQISDRADGFLDGHVGIEPSRPVDVDVVGAQPDQAVGQRVLHRTRPAVDPHVGPVRVALAAELQADVDLGARAAAQRLAQQQFVAPHPVEVTGVQQCHTGIERRVDGRDALFVLGRAVHVAHAHQAQPECGDLTQRAQGFRVHVLLLSSVGLLHRGCGSATHM
jgi:hypothetical protein